MAVIEKCGKYNGLYFYNTYSEKEWDTQWLNQFSQDLLIQKKLISKYTNIKKNPTVILVQPSKYNELQKKLHKSPNIKATTFKNYIIFFTDNHDYDWKDYLRHELFHFALYNTITDISLIPTWFNESIAFYITEKYSSNNAYFLSYQNAITQLFISLKSKIEEIKQLILTKNFDDTNLINQELKYVFYRIFGNYLFYKYPSKLIKNLLILINENKDFDKSVFMALEISTKELIDNWYNWLFEMINKEKAILEV